MRDHHISSYQEKVSGKACLKMHVLRMVEAFNLACACFN